MGREFSSSYVVWFIERLTGLYIETLRRSDPQAARLINKKLSLQRDLQDKTERLRAYVEFWEGLDEEQQLLLSSHDAKINHLARVARIMATTDVVWAHNTLKPTNAGSIDFVIESFRKEGVAAAQLQKFLDENAVAWFSLTGHPTNPMTVSYTLAQIKVAEVIANPISTPSDLKKALSNLCGLPVSGPSKTPLEEAEETLGTLDVIYDSALGCRRLFEDALEKYGYAAEGVRIRKALLRPCVWTLGDGDGNENMTDKVLRDGIVLHRDRIAQRYAKTCNLIIAAAKREGIDAAVLRSIKALAAEIGKSSGKNDSVRDEELCARDAEDLSEKIIATESGRLLDDLAFLLRCFGRGFGKIDLRHNARDIMETIEVLFHECDLMDKSRFSGLSLDEKGFVLSSWLEDTEVLQILSEKISSGVKKKMAARIVGRLRVIGENPDMCDKLIVAETTHPAHALAALFLLKITGNSVGCVDSRIDIIILSESVADLIGIGRTLETLLENETFRGHVAARRRLIAMIAKSDTTRQDGRGEAEYAQYEAAVEVYRVTDLMKRKYPDLESVLVSIKNGGGHALQRGGGRVTEIPAVHGRAAADARVADIGPSALTVQGQQQTILFCPGKTAVGTLEALAAQNLYTKAGVHGETQPPQFSRNINRQYARTDAWLFARMAGKAFDDLVSGNPAIDELLVAAPWLSMKAGNVSSRPARRGEKPVGPGVTPAEAKGKNPRALQGRAISGERLTAHACLPVFSILGMVEAMEAVQSKGAAHINPEKYGDPLHHLYRAHKIQRDGARATINAAAMADFDIAWPLLAGRNRPDRRTVEKLASEFMHSPKNHANRSEVTLAFLEEYFLCAEKLTYEMVSGQKPKKTMQHGDAFRKLWPDLAQQVEQRDRAVEFSRAIEAHRTRQFDANPDKPLSEKSFRITQAIYAAANVVNAPVGILATRTRLEPVQEIGESGKTRFMRPQSYQEKKIAHLLDEPPALRR